MVSAADQTFILEVLDYQQEFTIKFIIMGMILAYVIILKLWTSRLELNYAWQGIIKGFGNLMFWPTILFAPLYTLLLFREYDAIDLWTILFVFYGAIFFIVFVIWLIYGMEKALGMVGIKADFSSWKENKLYAEDYKSNLGNFEGRTR